MSRSWPSYQTRSWILWCDHRISALNPFGIFFCCIDWYDRIRPEMNTKCTLEEFMLNVMNFKWIRFKVYPLNLHTCKWEFLFYSALTAAYFVPIRMSAFGCLIDFTLSTLKWPHGKMADFEKWQRPISWTKWAEIRHVVAWRGLLSQENILCPKRALNPLLQRRRKMWKMRNTGERGFEKWNK